jgi:hypothetical protein
MRTLPVILSQSRTFMFTMKFSSNLHQTDWTKSQQDVTS